eukprot:1182391-Prorocentrum_minimum.AAC.5
MAYVKDLKTPQYFKRYQVKYRRRRCEYPTRSLVHPFLVEMPSSWAMDSFSFNQLNALLICAFVGGVLTAGKTDYR